MDIKKVMEEMQFITGVVSNDADYLLYLLLKSKNKEVEESSVVVVDDKDSYFDEESLEDWFNSI